MKLLELLVTIAIIAILATIGVPVVVKSGKKIKQKWYEINMWHEARLTAAINDDTPKSTFDYYMTNGANPQKYYWDIKPNGINP